MKETNQTIAVGQWVRRNIHQVADLVDTQGYEVAVEWVLARIQSATETDPQYEGISEDDVLFVMDGR